MKFLKIIQSILRVIVSIALMAGQQALVIGFAFVVFGQGYFTAGCFIMLLCIPMGYVNYWTWKFIQQFGVIDFWTANADTSEIDVSRENRLYNEKMKKNQ